MNIKLFLLFLEAKAKNRKTRQDNLFENEMIEHDLRKRKLELEIEFTEKEFTERIEMARVEHSMRMKILALEYEEKRTAHLVSSAAEVSCNN